MGGLLFTATAAADRGISSQGAKGTRKEKALLKQKVRGSLHAFHLISMRTATDADAADALAREGADEDDNDKKTSSNQHLQLPGPICIQLLQVGNLLRCPHRAKSFP